MCNITIRVKENGVPIITKKYMDKIAEKILLDYDSAIFDEPKSLDIEHFSECYMDLETDYQDLSHDKSILGMMVFNDGYVPVYDEGNNKAKRIEVSKNTILIDCSLLEEDQVRRGRFTHAHEAAHWLLHKHIYQSDKYTGIKRDGIMKCRISDFEGNGKRELVTDDDWMEWQANYLASALLMPKKVFSDLAKEKYKEYGIDDNVPYDKFEKIVYSIDVARDLAEIFDVSVTAAKIRLENLGLIN